MAGYELATYESENGPRAGIIVGESVFDAAELTGQPTYTSVLRILEDWARANDILAGAAKKTGAGWKLKETHLRAPVLWPPAIYCAGANYRDHAAEMAKKLNRPQDPDPKLNGGRPWHFIKTSRSVTDPGATVTATHYCKNLDWEIELTAVIGKPGKNIRVDDALEHVAGYTIANDIAARDLGRRA